MISTKVNPEVLKWARDIAGFSVEEISKKASIKPERYEKWERDGQDIPFGKLKIIASAYKRQIAIFLMKEVPEESFKKPNDYRNLNGADSELSKDVKLALRRATYFQKLAREFNDSWGTKYDWLNGIKNLDINNHGQVAGWVRKILKADLDKTIKWKDDNQAYRFWRNAIENEFGILVFQFSMPLEEVHGFCLRDSKPYVIVTNSNHPYTARSFTLFHELAHILRGDSGICFTNRIQDRNTEEWICNSLAGEILIPKANLRATTDLKEIVKSARSFRVSREAYLRRLKEEDLIADNDFFILLERIKSTYKKTKSKGFAPVDVRTRASRGDTLYNIVLGAVRKNVISFSEGAQSLGVSINQLANDF